MTKEDFLKEKAKLILECQTELTKRSTYKVQKAGISASTYTRLRLRPETMNMETLFKLLGDIKKIPVRRII